MPSALSSLEPAALKAKRPPFAGILRLPELFHGISALELH